MVGPSLSKLLSISTSEPLVNGWDASDELLLLTCGEVGLELLALLSERNGLFAFESALHVLPLGQSETRLTLGYWNDPNTWRQRYGDLLPHSLVYFAQDAFGEQFALDANGVYRVETECAEVKQMAATLEDWGGQILQNWQEETGHPLAHDWQIAHRPLLDGERLLPKIPFVIGGDYSVSNLYAGRIVEGMRFRADLARQIENVPDGSQVKLRVIRPPATDDEK